MIRFLMKTNEGQYKKYLTLTTQGKSIMKDQNIMNEDIYWLGRRVAENKIFMLTLQDHLCNGIDKDNYSIYVDDEDTIINILENFIELEEKFTYFSDQFMKSNSFKLFTK